MKRRVAARYGVAAGLFALLMAALGCEAIVGDSLGTVMCFVGPGACPAGQACLEGVCKPCSGSACLPPPHDGGFDARDVGVDRDATMPDVAPDKVTHDVKETSSLLPLGATCSMSAACASMLCAGTDVFTTAVSLPGAAVCTSPCCSSSDCNALAPGYVCYPSVGGNYCIDPQWIGLATPGAGVAGSSCGGGGDCLSGVCTSSHCQDTCCTDSDCMGGTVCQFSKLDQQLTFSCGLAPGSAVGQGKDCSVHPCDSMACLGVGSYPLYEYYCLGGCCKDSDCQPSSLGATSCVWSDLPLTMDAGQVELRACALPRSGGAGYLGSCSKNSDCSSGVCNKAGMCTKACCTSSDCGTWVCGPESFTLSGGVGTVDLQVCVPPA
jgi:hypothetical protein